MLSYGLGLLRSSRFVAGRLFRGTAWGSAYFSCAPETLPALHICLRDAHVGSACVDRQSSWGCSLVVEWTCYTAMYLNCAVSKQAGTLARLTIALCERSRRE